jgi:hypothetical protein
VHEHGRQSGEEEEGEVVGNAHEEVAEEGGGEGQDEGQPFAGNVAKTAVDRPAQQLPSQSVNYFGQLLGKKMIFMKSNIKIIFFDHNLHYFGQK